MRTPLRIDEGVVIGRGCSIGPNVYLERGAVVGDDVVLSNAIVQRNAIVATGRRINNQIV